MSLPIEFYKIGKYEKRLMLFKDYSLPERDEKNVLVRVEGEDDFDFWDKILHKYAPGFRFHVKPYAKHRSAKGQPEIRDSKGYWLKRYNYGEDLNERVILCLDSDYDYLLPKSTRVAKAMNSNSLFIFQTYTYAIENYRCYSLSLGPLCRSISRHDSDEFDFCKFLKQYSKIVFELFLLSVYYENANRQGGGNHFLSISRFSEIVEITNPEKLLEGRDEVLSEIKEKVNEEIERLKKSCDLNKIEEIRNLLVTEKGVDETNVYLFMKAKGHKKEHKSEVKGLDECLKQILPEIVLKAINIHLSELHKLITKNSKFQIKLNAYVNKLLLNSDINKNGLTVDQKKLIKNRTLHKHQSNYEHDNCKLMQKIIGDIKAYVCQVEADDKSVPLN